MRFFFCKALLWVTAITFVASLTPVAQAALSDADKAEIRDVVRQLLRDEPQLVLQLLQANSEAVLEIAQQGNIARKRKLLLAQWQRDATEPKSVSLEARDFRGADNAPVTIVAFSDYSCSYCLQSEAVLESMLARFKGKVRVVFKPLPKEDIPVSLAAAKYSLAAFLQDADKGWRLHDLLFQRIDLMEQGGDAFIKTLAEEIGLDYKKLRADAASSRVEKILASDRAEADALGITGTPFFLVNNLVIRGALSEELFEEAVKMALELVAKKK